MFSAYPNRLSPSPDCFSFCCSCSCSLLFLLLLLLLFVCYFYRIFCAVVAAIFDLAFFLWLPLSVFLCVLQFSSPSLSLCPSLHLLIHLHLCSPSLVSLCQARQPPRLPYFKFIPPPNRSHTGTHTRTQKPSGAIRVIASFLFLSVLFFILFYILLFSTVSLSLALLFLLSFFVFVSSLRVACVTVLVCKVQTINASDFLQLPHDALATHKLTHPTPPSSLTLSLSHSLCLSLCCLRPYYSFHKFVSRYCPVT